MSEARISSARLAKRLEALPEAILEHLRPALVQSAEEVAQNMRTLAEASRDTGALIESIETTAPGGTTPAYASGGGQRTAQPNEALVTAGNPGMRHGHLVEFGTKNMSAQPFMLPGFRLTKARVERRIKRAISAAIKKVSTDG